MIGDVSCTEIPKPAEIKCRRALHHSRLEIEIGFVGPVCVFEIVLKVDEEDPDPGRDDRHGKEGQKTGQAEARIDRADRIILV